MIKSQPNYWAEQMALWKARQRNYINSIGGSNSSYWAGSYMDTNLKKETSVFEDVALVRSIGNFVRLLTNKNIPVTFNTVKGQSRASSTEITISADPKKEFDSVVGLALHEGSHIAHSGKLYDVLKNHTPMEFLVRVELKMAKYALKYNQPWDKDNFVQPGVKLLMHEKHYGNIKDIVNFLEDRRIDQITYNAAPGYRGYYKSLYKDYFYSDSVKKGIRSKEFRKIEFSNYMFHLIASVHPDSQPAALPNLQKILDIVDIKNIHLVNDEEVDKIFFFDRALEMYILMMDKSGKPNNEGTSDEEMGKQKKVKSDMQGEPGEKGEEDKDGEEEDSSESESESDDDSDQPDGEAADTTTEEAITEVTEMLEKLISFGRGDSEKAPMDKEKSKRVHQWINSKYAKITYAEYEDWDHLNETDEHGNINKLKKLHKVPVLSIDITPQVLHDVIIPSFKSNKVDITKDPALCTVVSSCLSRAGNTQRAQWDISEDLTAGIQMGSVLAKKLKVVDLIRSTPYTKQKSGRIEGRGLYRAGLDSYDVFERIDVDKFTPSNLHISIDASGSMSGERWTEALKLSMMIATAVDKIENINLQISIRYIESIGGSREEYPFTLNVYDSTKNYGLQYLRKLLSLLTTAGVTPESLNIEGQLNLKEIMPGSLTLNSYFINMSDGQPSATADTSEGDNVRYSSDSANLHIAKVRKRMEKMNIKIISYFIGNGRDIPETFAKAWGHKNVKAVSTNDITAIAKSLNDSLIKK